ncbi:MAG: hypothetical protein ACMUHB_00550 [Thermoplasmatota archaeon]
MAVSAAVFIGGMIVIIGLILTGMGLSYWYRERVLVTSFTLPVSELMAGDTGVRGVVEEPDLKPLRTPIGRRRCVWYRTLVQRYRYHHGSDMHRRENVFKEEKGQEFKVSDWTGTVRVRPQKAELRLGNTIDRDVGGGGGSLEGFDRFCRENGIPCNRGFPSDIFHVKQEWIEPRMELKIIGGAQKRGGGSGPLNGGLSPYIIGYGGPSGTFIISDAPEGEMSKSSRFLFLLFTIIGGSVLVLGSGILFTSIL